MSQSKWERELDERLKKSKPKAPPHISLFNNIDSYKKKLQEAIDDEVKAALMYHSLQSTAVNAGFILHKTAFIHIAVDERHHKDWIAELLHQVKKTEVKVK